MGDSNDDIIDEYNNQTETSESSTSTTTQGNGFTGHSIFATVLVSIVISFIIIYIAYNYCFRWKQAASSYLSATSREITDSFELTEVDDIDKFKLSNVRKKSSSSSNSRRSRQTRKKRTRNGNKIGNKTDKGGLYMPPQEDLAPVEEEEESWGGEDSRVFA
mmetsp:Transcript_12683/g.14889  ORF Transcript_12683/g.14889 Transcript_12683/m.14889 type:complete len:161 (+) Transcript_12683:244-726(+)